MSNGFDVRGRVLEGGELAAWLAEHSLGNRFGLAVLRTEPAYGAGVVSKAVALAIVAADGDGRYIDTAALTRDDEEALASWLADPGPPKAVHEAKPVMHALAGSGWTLRGVTSDTASAARLLRPEQPSGTLNDLLIRHMRCALPTEPTDPVERGKALMLEGCAVLDLADVLDEELARIDSSSLLGRLELPVSRTLTEMETVGIAVDRALLKGADGVLDSIAPDGRLHPTFQTLAGTGMISSTPNVQDQVRDAFVAGDGYVELMAAGYVDLENRITAHLFGDAAAVDHPDGVVDEARRIGYVSTLLGRRRYLPELAGRDRQAREAAERAALAFVVSGSVADIIKLAMIGVSQAIESAGLKSRLLLVVSTELVFEVAGGERDALAAHVREHMGAAYRLHPPLQVSVGHGPSWGTAAR